MIRRPPSSTLFPYTTLSDLSIPGHRRRRCPESRLGLAVHRDCDGCKHGQPAADRLHGCGRSEEHTSELQSLRHLVCRLLLEKKKVGCTLGSASAPSRSTISR